MHDFNRLEQFKLLKELQAYILYLVLKDALEKNFYLSVLFRSPYSKTESKFVTYTVLL